MERVSFKGKGLGLALEIRDGTYEEVLNDLEEKVNEMEDFFQGAKLLSLNAKELTRAERVKLAYILKYEYDFQFDENLIADIIGEQKIVEKEKIEIVYIDRIVKPEGSKFSQIMEILFGKDD